MWLITVKAVAFLFFFIDRAPGTRFLVVVNSDHRLVVPPSKASTRALKRCFVSRIKRDSSCGASMRFPLRDLYTYGAPTSNRPNESHCAPRPLTSFLRRYGPRATPADPISMMTAALLRCWREETVRRAGRAVLWFLHGQLVLKRGFIGVDGGILSGYRSLAFAPRNNISKQSDHK